MSATFWRIAMPFDNTGGYNFVGIGEVRFKDAGGTILSTGGTAYADSYYSGTFAPSTAFDGVLPSGDAGWLSVENGAGNNHWLGYRTPAAITPTQVSLYPRDTYRAAWPSVIVLQYSQDGMDWRSVARYVTAAPVFGTAQTFTIPPV
jgi:hypothetical protein